MFKKFYKVKTLSVVIALVAGFLVGTLYFIPVVAFSQSSQDIVSVPVFPVNKNGETYGSLAKVNSPGQEPDLVMAIGVDGTRGYVKYVDLNGKQPRTPEEAIALQNSRLKEGPKTIPLYDVDGKTIIGEFKISKPKGIEITKETTQEDIFKVLEK
jgi:hypothetical protein